MNLNEIKLGVGQIPLSCLLNWLNHRAYTKEMCINYIKEVYKFNISTLDLSRVLFDYKYNVYEKFEKENLTKIKDDGTRTWFNSYGRRRYLKFYQENMLFAGDFEGVTFDEILDIKTNVIIHHIYPLEYNNSNNLLNLIAINKFNHKLLHLNPYQSIKKYCCQAIDYLYYINYLLIWENYICKKYNLKLEDQKPKVFIRFYKLSLKQEMLEFYERIGKEYEREICA